MCFIAVNLEKDEQVSEIAGLALRCELYLGTFMTFSVLTLAAFSQKYLINIITRLGDIDEMMTSILITVGSRFVMITTQLINTYHTIRDASQGNLTQYLVLSIYLTLHISKIFMIAIACENTSFKAKETGIYLHHIWELIPAYENEIKYFSMQVLHQNLTFTGCGFFALDNTLMYSIVGAVATYFVIFIQLERAF
ncbi:putative gustatory receptor [Trypoxylus dichotomus]